MTALSSSTLSIAAISSFSASNIACIAANCACICAIRSSAACFRIAFVIRSGGVGGAAVSGVAGASFRTRRMDFSMPIAFQWEVRRGLGASASIGRASADGELQPE